MNLYLLDPEELLKFLKSIKGESSITITNADIAVDSSDTWAEVAVEFNGQWIAYPVALDCTAQCGSIHYYKESASAEYTLKYLTIERITEWLDNIYKPWVKNDTGYNISDSFMSELYEEVERIINVM